MKSDAADTFSVSSSTSENEWYTDRAWERAR